MDIQRLVQACLENAGTLRRKAAALGAGVKVDWLSTALMLFRAYDALATGEPPNVMRLAREVAPELISVHTAIRYLRELERLGLIAVLRAGHQQLVELTPSGRDFVAGLASTFAETLLRCGIAPAPQVSSFAVLWTGADGRHRHAQGTGALFGLDEKSFIDRALGFTTVPAGLRSGELAEKVMPVLASSNQGNVVTMPWALYRSGRFTPVEVSFTIDAPSGGLLRQEFRRSNYKLGPSDLNAFVTRVTDWRH